MNLQSLLAARVQAGKPVRVGLIGAGKFGSMFLAQVPSIAGLEVERICDRDLDRAKTACRSVGWDGGRIARTQFSERGRDACDDQRVEIVVEATGDPAAGIAHALAAIEAHKPIIMVNVEADALAGPYLAAKARAAGTIYSLAYGDQPALIAEMVDWARAAGMNSQMFNSFLDGTKSAIEMTAVANACELDVPQDGLLFPPCGADALASVLRPKSIGGVLERDGMVEVVSSLERDGSAVTRDLRWGVYVVLKANDYAAACFKQYGLPTDATGMYAAMYKPYHLIGLELSISVLNAALRGEPTGACRAWRGDAVAVAKRALRAGETLDGEGGYTVYAKLIPAAKSLALGALPIGLAHHVKVTRDVAAGEILTNADVVLDGHQEPGTQEVVRIRREMEREAANATKPIAAE
jgi:predicted homoserine dehydrogenase-like protein